MISIIYINGTITREVFFETSKIAALITQTSTYIRIATRINRENPKIHERKGKNIKPKNAKTADVDNIDAITGQINILYL
jgi:hypothetical protein